MNNYETHAKGCNTCEGFDHPGSKKYSVTSRCKAGQALKEGQKLKDAPCEDDEALFPPITVNPPFLGREPEVFATPEETLRDLFDKDDPSNAS